MSRVTHQKLVERYGQKMACGWLLFVGESAEIKGAAPLQGRKNRIAGVFALFGEQNCSGVKQLDF